MSDERLPNEEELKTISENMFNVLNKEDMTENEKFTVRDTISKYPGIVSWRDFQEKIALPDLMTMHNQGVKPKELLEQSTQTLATTKRVLNNLQGIKDTIGIPELESPVGYAIDNGKLPNGETLGTQTIKNINFLQSLSQEKDLAEGEKSVLSAHLNKEYKDFLQNMYNEDGIYQADREARNLQGQKVATLVQDIVKDRKSLQVEKLPPAEKPRKTLTIDELKDKAYQGTLTVEQAEQLRKNDDKKKIADMASIPGDKKKTKHDSNDKFKDEDVIKYMYEDWFLGGMSWVFNKIENVTLDTVDAAIELYAQRSGARREKKEKDRNDRLGQAHQQAGNFCNMAQGSVNDLSAACQGKVNAYQSIFEDLNNNLNNPNPQWQYFNKDDEFVKKLEADPAQAKEFVNKALPELQNRTKIIEATGKLSIMICSAQMVDEFMGNDGAWKKKGKYKPEEELKAELTTRAQALQKNIFHAISVISEDSRLLAEYEYDKLSGTKPDFNDFRQQYINKEVNKFLHELATCTKDLTARQQKDIDAKNFEGIGVNIKRDYGIGVQLRNIDKVIDKTIKNGDIYKSRAFDEENSEKRIEAQRGLLEEAVQINSPNSMEKTFKKMQEINGYEQGLLSERRTNAKYRQERVAEFKRKISKRNTVSPLEILKNAKGKQNS